MQTSHDAAPQQIAPPRRGMLHVLDAAAYSLAGFRRLIQETAARLELAGALFPAVCFVTISAASWQWAVLFALIVLVLATEALSTAIEIVVDRASHDWSEAAKHAKDLGSLAVGLMLLLTFGFVLGVLVQSV